MGEEKTQEYLRNLAPFPCSKGYSGFPSSFTHTSHSFDASWMQLNVLRQNSKLRQDNGTFEFFPQMHKAQMIVAMAAMS